jgi:hypothetical protein
MDNITISLRFISASHTLNELLNCKAKNMPTKIMDNDYRIQLVKMELKELIAGVIVKSSDGNLLLM